MHPSLTSTYLLPAIFLNPILFLHSVNTILSRLLPPIVASGPIQPPPHSTLGPSGNYPHLDIHASDNLCWSYTAIMVCAQLVAFGSVSQAREEGRERKERKQESEERKKAPMNEDHQPHKAANGDYKGENGYAKYVVVEQSPSTPKDDSEGTEDEIIL